MSSATLLRPAPRTPHPLPSSLSLGHLDHLLTNIGLWQHTEGDQPNRAMGYSIDDEARGLIVALGLWQCGTDAAFAERLGGTCFRFLQNAAIADGPDAGKFHNFCDEQGHWLDPIGSDDSFGRTVWALGVAHAADVPFAPRPDVETLLRRSLQAAREVTDGYLRAKAFVILGLAACRLDDALLRELAERIASSYDAHAEPGWHWFEPHMTYCNARLPQAILLAFSLFPQETRWREIGTQSLDFLLQKTRNEYGSYDPVGNVRLTEAGWLQKGEDRAPRFDQQPVDAGALTEACAAAFTVTGDEKYRDAARDAFRWYLGANAHGLPLYDAETGAVADALHAGGVSENKGAESVVSIHMAWQALQSIGA